MRSQLQPDGKIPTPTSLAAARERLAAVEQEVANVGAQLDDIGLASGQPRRSYAEWRERAKALRGYLKEEARQLAEWIGGQVYDTSELDYATFWNEEG